MTEHSEVRERMADLLRKVPEIVNQCEQYQTLYPGRSTIQLCMNDIYINLLIALEAILEWYKQSSWSKSALPVPPVCAMEGESSTPPRSMNSPALQELKEEDTLVLYR